MAAELPRPGVEIVQVLRSVSPTIVTPTLVPCIVGVCRQVVDVLDTSSSGAKTLNGDALVPLAARFVAKAATGSPPAYTGLDTLLLVFSLNNAPNITVTFSGASLSPAQVAQQVQDALDAAGVTSYVAEAVSTTQWRLRSLVANENQTIRIVGGVSGTAAAVLTAFALAADKVYSGSVGYAQSLTKVYLPEFPDPNDNLDQLSIDPATIRAFLFMGGSGSTLQEVLQTQAFLRNGDSLPAVVTGTADLSTLTYPTDPGTKTVIISVDGGADVTATFSNPANQAAILSQLNAVFNPAGVTATANGSNRLVLTGTTKGIAGTIQVKAGTANGVLGLSAATTTGKAAIEAVSDGSGLSVTRLLKANGADWSVAPTAAVATGNANITAAAVGGLTLILDDGQGPQTLTFPTPTTGNAAILTAINGMFGSAADGFLTATMNGSNFLVLTHSRLGRESIISIVGGTALTLLGLNSQVGTTIRGLPYAPLAGDELWVNGQFYATIVEVSPGAQVDQLKIDKVVPVSNNVGAYYYIVAKGLSASAGSSGVTRPRPNLTMDLLGNLIFKPEIIRDVKGDPITTGKGSVYVSYKAVRRDVSPLATSPGLLQFNSTTELVEQVPPLSVDSPMTLGAYFALINAPDTQVTALGVDAASSGSPDGTVEAFTRAAEFLESYEVYGIAPMTHDPTVAGVFSTHVTSMSDAANKGERICIFNLDVPSNKLDTLVGSGVNGNTTGTPNQFDTGITDLGALLLAKGLEPTGTIPVSSQVYLDVGDGKKYNISSITGSLVTVRVSFTAGQNDDGYYATTTLPSPLIGQVFAIRIRGAALTNVDGTLDKNGVAETVQKTNQGYLNRRFWSLFPDQCAAVIDGVEQVIDGYYMCAAVAGMVGKQAPQQSFTNFPMSGFTRVIGSNDKFSEKQLNVMAAGGTYIIVQDAPATPLISRMALTTDMTSIETRTDSVTKVVDFTAKFLRQGLKNFIGRFNITQGFLDSLSHVIQGLLGFLEDSGVLIGSNLNSIIQDEDAPDTVLVDITLDVPFPCNYIRLTLVV